MNDSLEQFGDAFFMISVVCERRKSNINRIWIILVGKGGKLNVESIIDAHAIILNTAKFKVQFGIEKRIFVRHIK